MDAEQIQQHLGRIEKQGYTLLESAVDLDVVNALSEDLLRLERDLAITPSDNLFEGASTVRIYNLLVHGDLYAAIPEHPDVLALADGVLGGGCLISSLSSISIGPGEKAQPIHADDQLFPVEKPHSPFVFNSMWALTDFTDENGATRIIPGTHKGASPEYGQHYDSIPAKMSKGSILVWNGSLWHGGGANHTGARRVGIAMNYCAGYIRQQENQQLGIPRDIAKTFSPRLRDLVGYGVYGGLIGHIDKRSPVELLGDETPRRKPFEA